MTLTRRNFLASGAALAAPSGKRNILLILTDQQSNFTLSAFGNRYLRTPAMDSLVADGAGFRRSYCAFPVCSPARAAMFTGRAPHETGVNDGALPIRAGIPTMGHIFRQAGWRTAYAGKWHLPHDVMPEHGFERLVPGRGLGAKVDGPCADACVRFLDGRPAQPFLLVASFLNPHDICDWIREHRGRREHPRIADYPPAPANMGVDPREPGYLKNVRENVPGDGAQAVRVAATWGRDEFRHYLHAYYRLVETVDREIGRVLDALRKSPAAANTTVLLTSDHGEGMGAHRWVQKLALWEETASVPFVLAGAGVERRGVIDERSLVSGMDVLPTLCDYAGVPAPEKMRGISVRPAVRGAPLDRAYVVCELVEDRSQPDRQGRMARGARYKYIAYSRGDNPEQLFDLDLDPGETVNLAALPSARPVLEEHRRWLHEWKKKTDDPFPVPAS